jgi:hypothetical protein
MPVSAPANVASKAGERLDLLALGLLNSAARLTAAASATARELERAPLLLAEPVRVRSCS